MGMRPRREAREEAETTSGGSSSPALDKYPLREAVGVLSHEGGASAGRRIPEQTTTIRSTQHAAGLDRIVFRPLLLDRDAQVRERTTNIGDGTLESLRTTVSLTVIEEYLADDRVYYGEVSRAESLLVQAASLTPV